MSDAAAIVFVVDDDPSMREGLSSLIRSVGLRVETFADAHGFLCRPLPDAPACLVLDVRLPGQSGLDLQRELAESGQSLPIIFMTGHGDIPMSVRAMKAGATEFLPKPFRDQDLLDAIRLALEREAHARQQRARVADIHGRLASLTGREREVLALIVKGRLNKQTAAELDISEITVKVHRRHIMEKMAAGSLAELVRMVERAMPDGF